MTNPEKESFGPLFDQPLEPVNGLSIADLNRYLSAVRTADDLDFSNGLNEGAYLVDGLAGLQSIPEATVDLVVADPPQEPWEGPARQGQAMTLNEYYQWNQGWIRECRRILQEQGAIYLFSHWRFSGMYQALLSEVFQVQTRITWENPSGGGQRQRLWTNQLGDIWFATVSNKFHRPEKTDNQDDESIPSGNFWSARFPNHRDIRANLERFESKVLANIINASTAKLNWVVDPFMKTGATGVAAKKLGRRFIGFDVNKDHLLLAMKNIDQS